MTNRSRGKDERDMTDYSHKTLIEDFIRDSLDNAIDDMHDDGIQNAWIDQIAQNQKNLAELLNLRHSLQCPNPDELIGCAECGDDIDGMHFVCCSAGESDKCAEMLSNLIYGDFIRPRWETETMMAEPDHICRNQD